MIDEFKREVVRRRMIQQLKRLNIYSDTVPQCRSNWMSVEVCSEGLNLLGLCNCDGVHGTSITVRPSDYNYALSKLKRIRKKNNPAIVLDAFLTNRMMNQLAFRTV